MSLVSNAKLIGGIVTNDKLMSDLLSCLELGVNVASKRKYNDIEQKCYGVLFSREVLFAMAEAIRAEAVEINNANLAKMFKSNENIEKILKAFEALVIPYKGDLSVEDLSKVIEQVRKFSEPDEDKEIDSMIDDDTDDSDNSDPREDDDLKNYVEEPDESSEDGTKDISKTEIDNEAEIPEEVYDTLDSIMTRIEGCIKCCFELDTPYGILYANGNMQCKISRTDNTVKIKGGVPQSGKSSAEKLYKAILDSFGAKVISCDELKVEPTLENILRTKCNYYPHFMLKTALGFVEDKRYTKWGEFRKALKKYIEAVLVEAFRRNVYYEYCDKITYAYTTMILITEFGVGAGARFRVSIPQTSGNISNIANNIQSIKVYANSDVIATNVAGCKDVVDIQIIKNQTKYFSEPAWAYRALESSVNNGEPVSLNEGFPIGRKINGQIVKYKLDPSSKFITFIAAGSGSGKGVLTLSLAGAAIGSNIPLAYMDYKPDMASVFWGLEKKYNVETFTFDGLSRTHKAEASQYALGRNMPKSVERTVGRFAGSLFYLRALQFMCALARYQVDNKKNTPSLFVFDEIQAVQKNLKEAATQLLEIHKINAPKKVKGVMTEPNDVFKYVDRVLDWLSDINGNLYTYINTTGRVSGIYSIFIAQSPDWSVWSDIEATGKGIDKGNLPLLSQITGSGAICKIVGKGTTTSKYGLGGDGKKNITEKELNCVSDCRFFGMYNGKTTDGASIEVFKPFLTLNSAEPFDKCWTNGIGRSYGYDPNKTKEENSEYINNFRSEHPGHGVYSNNFGIDTRVGLDGLAHMFCGGDINRLVSGLGAGRRVADEFMRATGLCNKYATIEDYMYDFGPDAWLFQDEMIKYTGATAQNSEQFIGTDNTDTAAEDTISLGENKQAGKNEKSFEFGDKQKEFERKPLHYENITGGASEFGHQRNVSEPLKGREAIIFNPQAISPEERTSYCEPSMFSNGSKAFEQELKHDKTLHIDAESTEEAFRVDKKNSIKCLLNPKAVFEKRKDIFYKTVWGTEYSIKKRWVELLEQVSRKCNTNTVVSMILNGDELYFNSKLVHTENLLGGRDGIYVSDIVDFKVLNGFLPNIKSIMIDSANFSKLMLENKDLLKHIFRCCKKVKVVSIVSNGNKVDFYRGQELNQENSELIEDASLRNRVSILCATKDTRVNKQSSIGERFALSRGFDAARDFGISRAKKAFTGKKKRLFSGVVWGTIGLAFAVVGGVGHGIGSVFSKG